MKSLGRMKEFVKTVAFIYPITFKKCPGIFLGGNLFGVLAGLMIGIQTTVMAAFFDAVSVAWVNGWKKVFWWGAAMGLVVIGNEIVNGLMNYFLDCTNKYSELGYKMRLHEKAGKLSPIDYEKPEVLDVLEKASKGAAQAARFMSEVTELFTVYIPYLLYMGIYLFLASHVLAVSMLVIFIPVVINQAIRSHIFAGAEEAAAGKRRKRDYYFSCIADKEYIKETKLLGESGFFKGKFSKALQDIICIEHEAEKKNNFWKVVMAVITLLGYSGVLFLLVYSLLKGDILVGSFAAIFASIDMMYGIMCEIVEGRLGSLASNYGTVKNLTDFLRMPEKEADEKMQESGHGQEGEAEISIELKNVHFRYPGAGKEALKGINLVVRKGETLAVVGENGAGKSSLMKVMMGMYVPEKGVVRFNGSNTAKDQHYEKISAVFQRYQRYRMSLEDNIVISDPDRKVEGEDISMALCKADIPLSTFSGDGYGAMLSREFGGRELSGGQWQRVAIARGIYRRHDILFLDEPTAAIDPLEETELYHRFEEMCREKTAVIVTHRMGCTKIADRIVVMKDGEAVEAGTHQELYEQGGLYKRYWDMQAENYTAG